MTSKTSTIALAIAAFVFAAPVASAQTREGRSSSRHPYLSSGEIIARRAAEAQREPGVTRELAPDASQTATGGPVGGVPGFDGK